MKDDRLIREGGEELLRKALEFGHLMLKRVTITEQRNVGEEGEPYTAPAYVLYHESFRDHLLATDTVKYAVRAARSSILHLAINWSSHSQDPFTYRYGLRFGPEHFIDGNNHTELKTILSDIEFIEAKCTARMTYDLIEEYRRASVLLSASNIPAFAEFCSQRAAFLADHPYCAASEFAAEGITDDVRSTRYPGCQAEAENITTFMAGQG